MRNFTDQLADAGTHHVTKRQLVGEVLVRLDKHLHRLYRDRARSQRANRPVNRINSLIKDTIIKHEQVAMMAQAGKTWVNVHRHVSHQPTLGSQTGQAKAKALAKAHGILV